MIMKEYEKITWGRKQDVMATYRGVSQMQAVPDGHTAEITDFQLTVGENKYLLKGHDLEVVVENILCPNSESESEFRMILRSQSGLVRDLLKIKAFSEGHFDFLISKCGINDREKVLQYYLQEDIMLSEEKAEKYLDRMAEYELKSLGARHVQDNILGIVLLKRIEEKKRISYEWTEKASEVHGDIAAKEEKVPDHKGNGELIIPLAVLISTVLPAVLFAVEAFLKKKVSDQVYIPVALTVLSVLIVALSLVFWFCRDKKEVCLSGVLGGALSFLAIWGVWYIY